MAFTHLLARVLVALSFVSATLASVAFDSYIDHSGNGGNITFALNVPTNGTDDLFFHFHAPSLYQWAAFGFGEQMKGALMFIVYNAQDGNNTITVSPRIATGNTPPSFTKDVQVNVLNGSGITSDGVFFVNARCVNCRKWNGGQLDLKSKEQPFILAVGPRGEDFASTDVQARITKHDNHGLFTLDMQKATGDAGVPVLSNNDTKLTETNAENAEEQSFPIAVHALLLLACFLFILPSGYLFLRVFNKVWLHAGIQAVGVICLFGGVAAGIVYNVKSGRQFSYHQAFGIITSFLVLAAFCLGMISHQYFKKRKVSSPLVKYHRMLGPSAITSGWITIITGFVFRGEPRRILPFMVVLLAVIIFIGSISWLMKRRAVRKAAMVTPAAQNFNAGYYQQGEAPPPAYGQSAGYYAPNGAGGEGVPMQTFNQSHSAPGGYFGQQNGNAHKAPEVTVHPGNRI